MIRVSRVRHISRVTANRGRRIGDLITDHCSRTSRIGCGIASAIRCIPCGRTGIGTSRKREQEKRKNR